MKFIWLLIQNPLKPVAGSQWHRGLRCLASSFGIRLVIFVFVDFAFFTTALLHDSIDRFVFVDFRIFNQRFVA